MTFRIILTLLLFLLFGWLCFAVETVAPLVSGKASVAQLDDTDQGYIVAHTTARYANGKLPFAGITLILLLVAIWIKPIRTLVTAMLLLVTFASPARAYYQDHDEQEFVQIKANQTAFLVPQQGKNKEGQAAFDSAAYLNDTKVAEKRIQIPHQYLPKYGMFTRNMWIPASVLYVVTRAPFVRQWTRDQRGTSKEDQGFRMESSESLNVAFDVSIGAHITIEQAAVFLFHFGVADTVNSGDDANFPSEVYARALDDVMDKVVHQRVQTLLAKEYGSRSLTDCIHQKAEIMAIVEDKLIKDCAGVGITIEYVGYASELTFDPEIQKAINEVYVSQLQAQAADNQMRTVPARTAQAEIAIKMGVAQAIGKWNGDLKLPNFLFVSDQLANMLGGFMKPADPVSSPAPKK